MKLKQILLEKKQYRQYVAEKEAIAIIKNKCLKNFTHSFKKNNFLYRGTDIVGTNFVLYNSSLRTRKIEKNSYSNILIDNFPEWKKYPKKLYSINTSTRNNLSYGKGDIFYVLPFDNINQFAVCPTEDFWSSFKVCNINNFNKVLEYIFANYYKIANTNAQTLPYQALKTYLSRLAGNKEAEKDIVNYLEKIKGYNTMHFIKNFLFAKNNIKKIQQIMDPVVNHFNLCSYQQIPFSDDREVWFEGQCLLINEQCGDDELMERIMGKL